MTATASRRDRNAPESNSNVIAENTHPQASAIEESDSGFLSPPLEAEPQPGLHGTPVRCKIATSNRCIQMFIITSPQGTMYVVLMGIFTEFVA